MTLSKIKLKYKEADTDYWLLRGKFNMFHYVLTMTEDYKLIADLLGSLLTADGMDDDTNTIYVSDIFKTAINTGALTDELKHKLMYALIEADVPVGSIRWIERNLLGKNKK
ncbi:hypothetical protein WBG78_28375 [Chryseolinea sp. T2]|uniref:hypothetical protein n=1 Tax=Chryseolinea sp. T2 TaxID=3129255 RepID=UPI003077205B